MLKTFARGACCAALAAAALLGGAVALTGCDATAPGSTVQSPGDGVRGRRFTVPQAYFGDKSQSACEDVLKEHQGTDIERNDDGSYTVTMSDEAFAAFVKDSKEQTEQVLDAIPRSGDYPQIASVTYNEGFTQIDFTCAKDSVGEQGENAASIAIYVSCLHQTIAGDPLKCTVRLLDPSGAVIDTYSYPELK